MLGSTFKKALCSSAAIALISAAGMTASKDAEAAASAYSALEVSAMGIFFSTGVLADIGVPDGTGGGGFTSFSFTSQGGSVQLGGLNDSQTLQTTGLVTTSGATLNQAQLCLVDCTGFAPDDYVSGAAGVGNASAIRPGVQHAVTDSNMLNTVLNGAATANFGTQAGAKSTGGATLAAGTINAGSTMNWNFTTDSDDAGKVVSLSWLESRLTEIVTENVGDIAQVGLNFKITLERTGNTPVTMFDLDAASGNAADLFSPFGVTSEEGVNDILTPFSTTANGTNVTLIANQSYELVFLFDSFATATSTRIPEPGALGLLGAGLIGLGALSARRRRQQKAAK